MSKRLYPEIVEALVAQIAGLRPGDRVPGELEIAAHFGVSRTAARSAVQQLEDRLLVRRVRGSGTFVTRQIEYTLSSRRTPSFHQTVREAGGVPRSVVREITRQPLPDEVAERLGRPPGSPAHRLIRQFYIDGLLSNFGTEWIPGDVLPDAADIAVLAEESVDRILRQMGGVDPVRTWCRVSLVPLSAQIAPELELPPERHAWFVESLSRNGGDGGRALMCSSSWWRPDMVRMVVEL